MGKGWALAASANSLESKEKNRITKFYKFLNNISAVCLVLVQVEGFYIRLEYFWGQELWLLVVDNALPHVLLQRARHAERHGTEATLERVVAGPAVGLHVPRQLATLGTGVWAQLTLVGLLPGMRSPMDCQVAAVLEHLPAVLARVVLALPDDLLA